MIGSLALGQELAGLVVGLMFSGGAALEDDRLAAGAARADRARPARARRSRSCASAIASRRCRSSRCRSATSCSCARARWCRSTARCSAPRRSLDTSTLSGEPLPVTIGAGMPVLSGSANAGAPFELRADRPAAESAYAALVRLVEQAQAQRAPFVRMADRYAGLLPPGHAAGRRRWPGRSAATRSGRWRSWWSPRRAR